MSDNTKSNCPVFALEVGGYMMHHLRNRDEGTLVRIDSINELGHYGICYIQARLPDNLKDWQYASPEKGWIVGTGGYSFSWPAEEFRPVTDPEQIALVHVFHALHEEQRLAQVANHLAEQARIWSRSLQAIRAAQAHLQSTTAATEPEAT